MYQAPEHQQYVGFEERVRVAVEARVEERLREILQQREGPAPPVTGFLLVEWRSFLNRWDQAGIFPIQVAQRFMGEMPRWASPL